MPKWECESDEVAIEVVKGNAEEMLTDIPPICPGCDVEMKEVSLNDGDRDSA